MRKIRTVVLLLSYGERAFRRRHIMELPDMTWRK